MPRQTAASLSGFRSRGRVDTAPYPSSRPPTGTQLRSSTGRPRTASSATRNDANVIAAVTEGVPRWLQRLPIGRGVANSVGMCFLSLDTGECILSQVSTAPVRSNSDFRFPNIRQNYS